MLGAWAAAGPNDAEGQELLAEALRIDPAARVAQMAFERMEGVPGEHAELEAPSRTIRPHELAKLEAEMRRPSFRRAQMGFNNNIKYREQVFHVQTEDSGLDQPHIITHLFADGGRIIKSHKRSYAKEVRRTDVAEYVRGLMKGQHLEMVLTLRDGRFDEIIAGREIGGMEVLTEPPKVNNIKKLAGKKKKVADARTTPREAPEAKPAPRRTRARPNAERRAHFSAARAPKPDRRPGALRPPEEQSIIGSEGAVALPGERFCHPREASLTVRTNACGSKISRAATASSCASARRSSSRSATSSWSAISCCASSETPCPTTAPIRTRRTSIRRPSGPRRFA